MEIIPCWAGPTSTSRILGDAACDKRPAIDISHGSNTRDDAGEWLVLLFSLFVIRNSFALSDHFCDSIRCWVFTPACSEVLPIALSQSATAIPIEIVGLNSQNAQDFRYASCARRVLDRSTFWRQPCPSAECPGAPGHLFGGAHRWRRRRRRGLGLRWGRQRLRRWGRAQHFAGRRCYHHSGGNSRRNPFTHDRFNCTFNRPRHTDRRGYSLDAFGSNVHLDCRYSTDADLGASASFDHCHRNSRPYYIECASGHIFGSAFSPDYFHY